MIPSLIENTYTKCKQCGRFTLKTTMVDKRCLVCYDKEIRTMETQVIFYPSWLDADGKVRTGTSRENKAECLSFLKNTRNPERLKRPDIAHFVKVKTIEYIRIE